MPNFLPCALGFVVSATRQQRAPLIDKLESRHQHRAGNQWTLWWSIYTLRCGAAHAAGSGAAGEPPLKRLVAQTDAESRNNLLFFLQHGVRPDDGAHYVVTVQADNATLVSHAQPLLKQEDLRACRQARSRAGKCTRQRGVPEQRPVPEPRKRLLRLVSPGCNHLSVVKPSCFAGIHEALNTLS